MTTQDSSALDEKEAERLASMIRPAWEVDDEDSSVEAATGAAPATAKSAGGEASEIAAKLATDPGAPPARDTVIDGSPTIGVGPTDPGPPPEAAVAGAPKKILDAAPQPAGPTKLGMGDDFADGLAQADAAADRKKSSARGTIQGVAPPSTPPPASGSVPPAAEKGEPSAEVTEALAVGPSLRNAAVRRTDVIEAPALAPVKPQPASFSRADDPIEIPVRKSSNTTLILVGLVAAVAAIVGGVMLLGGDDPKPDTKKQAAATMAEPEPTSTAAAKPVETAAQTAAPLPTISAEPSATVSATASASATATATETAVATVEPPKPEVTNKPPPPKATATGGGKPPPKGGGGIIRDTPF